VPAYRHSRAAANHPPSARRGGLGAEGLRLRLLLRDGIGSGSTLQVLLRTLSLTDARYGLITLLLAIVALSGVPRASGSGGEISRVAYSKAVTQISPGHSSSRAGTHWGHEQARSPLRRTFVLRPGAGSAASMVSRHPADWSGWSTDG
jgi:hypothetical protein